MHKDSSSPDMLMLIAGSNDYNLSEKELFFKRVSKKLDPDYLLIASPLQQEVHEEVFDMLDSRQLQIGRREPIDDFIKKE